MRLHRPEARLRRPFCPGAGRRVVLPDLTVLWVVFFVLLLAFVLDRVLLRPITRVIDQREQAIRSAREMAEGAAAKARAATEEFEQRTAAARGEVYRQMDEVRRDALDRRQHLIAETRTEVEKTVAEASARVKADADAAREKLRKDAEALGAEAADRILGRKTS
jgi:F-type H+-transporting ATPase subunit b